LKIDTADRKRTVSTVRIQYIRTISPPNVGFEPYKLAFVLDDPENASDPRYYFRWEDAVAAAKGNAELQALIDAIVKGSLDFESTSVVDGVVGSR